MFPLKDNIPSKKFPFINLALIGFNLYVFFQEWTLSQRGLLDSFFQQYALIPTVFLAAPAHQFWRPFSAMFLHGSWGHVLGNMWFLFIFGDNVEDNMGHARYLVYYLLCGAGAAAAELFMRPTSTIPMVGASGAIAGVLGGYFLLYPKARVTTLFWFFFFLRFVEIPAFFFLGFWFVVQAINGLGSIGAQSSRGEIGGVAWWAHAGGFIAGFLLIPFFRTRRKKQSLL